MSDWQQGWDAHEPHSPAEAEHERAEERREEYAGWFAARSEAQETETEGDFGLMLWVPGEP